MGPLSFQFDFLCFPILIFLKSQDFQWEKVSLLYIMQVSGWEWQTKLYY